ncbi:hypothetical protein JCM3765_001531 [Sporobolomyces pararoseus]
MPLTIPSPLTRLYSYFPLLVISTPDTTTPAPSLPTLWVLGPPPGGQLESLDPLCRKSQALLRFKQIKFETKWLQDSKDGTPGNSLPCLHLGNGDLLDTQSVNKWINSKSSNETENKQEEEEEEVIDDDPIVQAYTSLVETTLLPSVISALYLTPSTTIPVTPLKTSLPFLSNLVDQYLSVSRREEKINQVKLMRGGKIGKKTGVVLDLEEIERDAVETLEVLEDKLKEVQQAGEKEKEKEKWFLGNKLPSQLDGLIYSLLSIISILPEQSQSGLLRKTLDKRCPSLTKWYKSLEP